MTVRPITIIGHRALEQRTRKVREITEDIRELVADMFETNDAADGAGLAGGRASVSTKHTLAMTNRGDATTEDVLTIARTVRDGVRERFGVELHPEPMIIGTSL